MKVHLIVLVCILTKSTSQTQDEKSEMALKMCSEKTNLNITTQEEFINRMATNDEPIRLFSECYLRELGYLGRNGSILYNEVKKNPPSHIAADKYSQIVMDCASKAGENTPEGSYKFMKCLLNNVLDASSNLGKLNALVVCSKETNLNITSRESFIKALAMGGKTIKLYSKCYLQQLNFLDNGTILYDKVKKTSYATIPMKLFSTIVDHCKNEEGKDNVETCYMFTKCLLNNVLKCYHQRAQRYLKKLHAITVCSGKTNLSLTNHDAYVKGLAAGGKQMQLFSECYLSELEYLDTNGNILYKEFKKLPSPGLFLEQYSSFVNQCKGRKGNGIAETSYEFLKCVELKVKEFYQNQKILD